MHVAPNLEIKIGCIKMLKSYLNRIVSFTFLALVSLQVAAGDSSFPCDDDFCGEVIQLSEPGVLSLVLVGITIMAITKFKNRNK